MLDSDSTDTPENSAASGDAAAAPRKRAPRKAAAKKAPPAAEAPAAEAPAAGAGSNGPTDPPGPDAAAPAARKRAPRKAAAKKAAHASQPTTQPAGEPSATPADAQADAGRETAPTPDVAAAGPAPAKKASARKSAAKKAPTKRATKVAADAAALVEAPSADAPAPAPAGTTEGPEGPAGDASAVPAKKPARKRAAKKAAPAAGADTDTASETATDTAAEPASDGPPVAPGVLFMPPTAEPAPRRRRAAKKAGPVAPAPTLLDGEETDEDAVEPAAGETDLTAAEDAEDQTAEPEDVREVAAEQATGARRRRRRGRRGRGGAKSADGDDADGEDDSSETEAGEEPVEDATEVDGEGGTRRRRRRRRSGAGDDDSGDDPANTVTHVREPARERASGDDGVKGVKGSTRLEAKRQRRRDGRETTRRRAPILTEAEFLARREAVDRVMAVRQTGERTQIAVLEDGILVEHYVTRASATSYVGNVYLGRVQNVLPSMEAAFVDIGKGRNGVLYAGEVNWDAAGLEGKSRAIENAMKSGDPVLVQVTKDPIGHKGARLTSQVSLPGRFLVYVPGGGMTGISRRLPDTERHRLKAILKKIVPEDGGVIVRTAAEGASEEDLTRDVERLTAQWEAIQEKAAKAKNGKQSAPSLVHGEPDLATRVVRDVFNEDFQKLVVQGDRAWETVSEYVEGVAPDLAARVSKHAKNTDLFADLRVDEQLMKALDRKVWLPSGGSLIIDRTEAMVVIDVNTGKFVGAGGNLEQTVTRNNLEAAEEIVRQLRLRDIGGIVVIDFIDMVLESNRELVLRRLTECLGRDRTKHQVAEVTSLGLVQMTRKRIGEGLLEAFSDTCEHCKGRGVIVHTEPVDKPASGGNGGGAGEDDRPAGKSRRKRGRGAGAAEAPAEEPPANDEQRRAAAAAIAAIHRAAAAEKGEDDWDGDSDGGSDGDLDGHLDALASGLVAAAMAGSSGNEADGQAEVETSASRNGRRKGGKSPADAAEPAAEPAQPSAEPAQPSAEPAQPSAEPAESIDEAAPEPAREPEKPEAEASPAPRRRRRAASRPAGPPSVA